MKLSPVDMYSARLHIVMYSLLLWQAIVQAQTNITRNATLALGNSTTATPATTSGKTTSAPTQTPTSIGYCPPSKTGRENVKGIFSWPKTRAGKNETLKCNYQNQFPGGERGGSGRGSERGSLIRTIARRFCNKNGAWEMPNDTACAFKSFLTNTLKAFSQSNGAVTYVLTRLKNNVVVTGTSKNLVVTTLGWNQ